MLSTLFARHKIVLIIFALGLLTKITTLWYPPQVIFDEVHFGKFVTAYCCTGERIFDIHPPHGKLLIAAAAYLGGYRGGFDFDHIGEVYPDITFVALRFLPAVVGSLIPVLAFVLLRQLNTSVEVSFLAGLALVFDNALTVQSRLISLDSLLIGATLGALVAWLLAVQSNNGRRKIGWIVIAGALAGLAVGIKLTGLSALAILGVLLVHQLITSRNLGRVILSGLIIAVSAAAVYLLGWFIHFALLTNAGSGDVWGIPTGNFVQDVIKVNQQMLSANYYLTESHPYSSKWWTWPVMLRPIFYWVGANGGQIYFLGNPIVWWGSSLLFIVAVFSTLVSVKARQRAMKEGGWIFFAAYFIAFMPFWRVPRALFLYHYLTPLIFSLLAGLWWWDRRYPGILARSKLLYGASVVALIIFFIFLSPLTYGWPLAAWQSLTFWLPTWR